jgi:hypothetical protein
VITAGVDLAAQPERTAIASIEWAAGRAVLKEVASYADDDAILRSKAAFADWWKTTASDRFTSKINLTRKLGLEVSASKLIQIMSHVTSTSVPARDTQTSAGVGQLPVGRSRDCLLVQVRIPRRHDGWREPARGLLSALRGIDAPGRLDQLRKVVW